MKVATEPYLWEASAFPHLKLLLPSKILCWLFVDMTVFLIALNMFLQQEQLRAPFNNLFVSHTFTLLLIHLTLSPAFFLGIAPSREGFHTTLRSTELWSKFVFMLPFVFVFLSTTQNWGNQQNVEDRRVRNSWQPWWKVVL